MPILKSCAKCGRPIIEGMYCRKCAEEMGAVEKEKPKRITAGDIAFTALLLAFLFLFWRRYQEFRALPPGAVGQVKGELLLLPGILLAKYYQAIFGKSAFVGAQITYMLLAILFYVVAFVILLLVKKKLDW